MSKNILALVKFGKKEHLEQLREDGLLYMKSLADFRDLESDGVRGDRFEGCDTIIQPRDIGEFTFTHPLVGQFVVSPSDLAGPVSIGLERTASCNVYCMFAITGPIDEGFDRRLFEFPDTDSLIVVLNPGEFVRRVSLAANAYQQEFRFVVWPGSAKPRLLSAGTLADITSAVVPLSQANERFDFSTRSAQEAGLPR